MRQRPENNRLLISTTPTTAPAARRLPILLFAVALAAVGCGGAGSASEVFTWEEQVVIPTYPLRPDDPNPQFFELGGSINYPYTTQDGFTTELVDRLYRVVFLENEYLRIMCLPEIGGRIHSVYDKVRGEEMFHANQVIKPGHIALRGAWVSGGIEWNRGPRGHTVTSFSPVDVVGVHNPDGSATLVIGYTEMNFRTGWTVRLTLHPGKAYLDEQIEIFNPTDGVHPYYFWNNTAFPQLDGTRFIYPMTLGSDHNGEVFFSWPVHEGNDLTWLKNYPGPTSVFGYEVPFDFFGAYDVDRDYGIVQVADHNVLPGKKAWTWGQSDVGMAAQAVLTDEDGPYIEVQSGPLPTQADFEMLAPGERVTWQEFWYPVGGLVDGFEYATRDMAVQRREAGTPGSWNAAGPVDASGADVEQPASGVELRLLATGVFQNAHVEVTRQEDSLVSRSVNFDPRDVQVIPLAVEPGTPVHIEVAAADGTILLSYESPLDVPAKTAPVIAPPPSRPGISETYLAAHDRDKAGDRVGARRGYEAVIAFDVDFDDGATRRAAHLGLSVLDIEAGLYEDARRRLDAAVAGGAVDGMIHYLRGIASLRLGDLETAAAEGLATVTAGMPALGNGLVGRVAMLQSDAGGAVAAFDAALAGGEADRVRLTEALMLAVYASGDFDRATALASETLAEGTVRLVPWAVRALAEAAAGDAGTAAPSTAAAARERISDTALAAAAERFARSVDWVGEAEFTHLELAFTLADLGLVREAAALTRAALIDGAASPRPLPLYAAAHFERGAGDDTAADTLAARAAAVEADYVFPSRPAMVDVLRKAIALDPADARAYAYLGTLYAGLGRLDEAEVEWSRAVELDASLSVAARNLGLLAWRRDTDLAAAANWYRSALSARPTDQTLHRDLAQVLIEQGDVGQAIAVLEGLPVGEFRRPDVVVLLAATYADVGRFDDALDLLASQTFTNREGVRATWDIFSAAHIERGIEHYDRGVAAGGARAGEDAAAAFDAALADFDSALTYPQNLNAGRAHEPPEARAQYWRGMALDAMGRADQARQAWEACVAGVRRGAQQLEHVRLCEAKLR